MSELVWTCPGCEEEHGQEFDACWSCGEPRPTADLAGPFRGNMPTPDVESAHTPSFDEVGGLVNYGGAVETVPVAPTLAESLVAHFKCGKCEGRSGKTRKIATTGTGISKILNVQHNHFIALSCTHCGFTELYDPSVLEGKPVLSTIMDLLFR